MPKDLSAILEALGERDADGLRTLLLARGVDVGPVRGLAPWNSPNRADGHTHRTLFGPPSDKQIVKTIEEALGAASGPDAALDRALLGLYIWHECREAWERSYQFQPILKTIDDTCRALDTFARRGAERESIDAVKALLIVLKRQILVEDKLTVGDLAALAVACEHAAGGGTELAGLAASGSLDPGLADFLAAEGDGGRLYYAAAGRAARAAREFLDGAGTATLTEAITEIDSALREGVEEDLLSRIDISELRAHRARLISLRDAATRPWLRVEHGQIVYIYPFGTRGTPPEKLADEVLARGLDWRPLGLTPVDVTGMFEVDDVFAGYSPDDRRFDGTTITLPRVRVAWRGSDHGIELRCELRFSKLGNHYLRLSTDLIGTDPHELAQALFLPAPEHGQIKVTSGAHEPWPRLSSYAMSLIESLTGVCEDFAPGLRVSVRPGMYHVVVSVLAASIGTGPNAAERRDLETAADFPGLVGAQILGHPVPNAVGALTDWIDYLPALTPIDGPGEASGLLARTTNTTLLVMPASPSFMVEMHAALAEFAGSIEGLFGAWYDTLEAHERHIADVIARLERAAPGRYQELAEEVRDKQVELRRIATEVGSTLALLRSPALVAAPVDARTLAALLADAGAERAEKQLNRKINDLLGDRIGAHLDAIARKEDQERDRADRKRLDTVVTFVAATGAAGVIQVFQGGLDATGGWATTWFLLGLVVFAVAAALWARHTHLGTRELFRRFLRRDRGE